MFRLQRQTLINKSGQRREQIVYGITNLSGSQANAEQLLHLVRQHWSIENRLHWRRDATLGEDRCQSRTGRTPHVLTLLKSGILSVMDRFGVSNVRDQMRWFQSAPEQAVRLVLTGRCQMV